MEPQVESRSADSPILVVESFFRALEAQDHDRIAALLTDDVVYQNVPFPPDRGKEAVLRTLDRFERVITKFEVRVKNIAARGDVVLTERVDVLSGPYVYMDIWVCGTFEVKNGKIALWRDYFDLAEVTGKLVTGPVKKLLGFAR
jgi:limonene-1,2-epoxide hydrolase